MMGIFNRKSNWERAIDVVEAVAVSRSLRRAAKVGAGVAVGLFSATAVSAAVSSAREGEGR